MTNLSYILLSIPKAGVGLLSLNRPEKRNALNGEMIREWIGALQKIAADQTIKIVLLNGKGEHFCAGADIAWMQKMAQCSHAENVQDARELALLLQTLSNFPKPIIGLAHGATLGGGLGVLACCDIVIAEQNASFCFSEVKMGLTPSVISPYVIPVIGERQARYYFLTAEKFTAEIAAQLNLVQQVVSVGEGYEIGLSLALSLLKNSPNALVEVKKIIRQVTSSDISAELIQMTSEHLATMRASKDAREGLQAFLEKRMPVWS